MTTLPTFSMRQLIEAGCHFGHSTRRWNPKMDSYLYGVRDGIHIIDLQQTVPLLHRAMQAVHDVVAGGGRVLFVGTKRQAHDLVKEYAERCGQYYVNHRWLGGMLTNWNTISKSIKRLKELEERFSSESGLVGLTKKEALNLEREKAKLDLALGGIKDMGNVPDLIFVIDTNKEDIAVAEANKLHIPVAAVLDSNSNPKGITYPIPGNDDAIRAIKLYLELMASSALEGIQDEMKAAGVDVGAQDEAPAEDLSAIEAPAEEAPAATPDAAAEAEPAQAEAPAAEKPAADEKAAPEKKPAAKKAAVKKAATAKKATTAKKTTTKKAAAKKTTAKNATTKKAPAKRAAANKAPAKKAAAKKATTKKAAAKKDD